MSENKGYLVVVGTGLSPAGHITVEAKAWLERADRVFHAVSDPAIVRWLTGVNPFIQQFQPPWISQETLPDQIFNPLAAGESVCLALAGHPAVYQSTGRALVAAAQKAGYRAWLTPAVSAEDCLFADLSVDPGRKGGQTFTATHFLLYKPVFDPTAHLILWGLDRIGRISIPAGLALLQEALSVHYPSRHTLSLYDPPDGTGRGGKIYPLTLGTLTQAQPSPVTLFYVPPRPGNQADEAMSRRLRDLHQISV